MGLSKFVQTNTFSNTKIGRLQVQLDSQIHHNFTL
jgi:hypothetical protein